MRRNSILKLILCNIKKILHYRTRYTRWRVLYDKEIEKDHLIIYECEDCGAISVIDYQKEALEE